MARRKPKKRPYQQPPHEISNRKPRAEQGPSRREQRLHRQEAARGRELEPPSLRRILRRIPLAMFFFVLLTYILPPATLVESGASQSERLQAAFMVSILMTIAFVPMSYVMDKVMYRSWQKRIAKRAAADGAQKTEGDQ